MRENSWLSYTEEDDKNVEVLAQEYKEFLSKCKTERECTQYFIKEAESHGYQDLNKLIAQGNRLKAGDKVYFINRDKNIFLAVIGANPIADGFSVVGAHIDSPRLDLKPNPLYEDTSLAYLKTHYYGGIKKYQWVTIPLAIHGVIALKDGTNVEVRIGEEGDDTTFVITDLLPHMARKQMEKKLSEGIEGEDLNLLIGSIPFDDDKVNEKVKLNIMKILNEKYGIIEKDFISAELEIVPAFKANSIGFDRSMVGGYGQDDRVCAYTSLQAILETEKPEKTAICLLVDKEEIGSIGNTGMESRMFETFLGELLRLHKEDTDINVMNRCLALSRMLSADVDGAYDPIYASASEKRNASFFGMGVGLNKYTGARGKSGANDANAEYVASLRKLFDDNKVRFQISELGKVDEGGGGTIAYILANKGLNVIDCGTPVLSMHSPYEVSSKFDVYMSYKAYKVFFE